jgi:hypothetical protein
MENENDLADISITAEEEVLETSNDEGNDGEELAERLAKAEELAENYKIRAEKAERMAKASRIDTPTTPKQTPTAGELTTKDLYALIDAKVPEADIEEVREYAQLKHITIAEALKSNVVDTILKDNQEKRSTASASNVGGSKRGTGKTSDDVLLAKAAKGELPDNDADMQRVIKLRLGIKD